MDFLKKQLDNATHGSQQQSENKVESSGGLMGKLNNALGGGEAGEKKEGKYFLDKGVDFVQEHFLGQGQQKNESALEQAKDEQISDAIRSGYKSMTGKDFPIADKS
ncbi:uncharacterized protein EV420DRAFT_1644055 [Desarmillaria tabescens]|uniref:DNA damage-responsive protein 48 n=1 Tax=Armillaria tabescens TaxID=1929756 RepID=A0AA39N4M7_ARMTA|nr:uncharacterized protein EV420DRAFT_1644055 [Desarmillaria tabescens]KAK0457308.1 hypothetical protein EV420DRAFT_1644055 [Desarmillaria tabescens]